MKSYTTRLSWWDRIMVALTFAEANEAEAVQVVADLQKDRPEKRSSASRGHGVDLSTEAAAKIN